MMGLFIVGTYSMSITSGLCRFPTVHQKLTRVASLPASGTVVIVAYEAVVTLDFERLFWRRPSQASCSVYGHVNARIVCVVARPYECMEIQKKNDKRNVLLLRIPARGNNNRITYHPYIF